jgi:HEAT repeat protein
LNPSSEDAKRESEILRLMALLKSGNRKEQIAGIEALEKTGELTVGALIRALKDEDEDAEVRKNAAFALGAIGDARAVIPLLVVLQNEDDEWSLGEKAPVALEAEVREAAANFPLSPCSNETVY